jgi:spore maturation protein CgeB
VKVLLIEPGASWSTADVSAGLLYGLEYHGVQVIRYRLAERIEISNRMLYLAWRRAKKKTPTIMKPTDADVFFQAGKDALCTALWHEVDCVLVVSAMFLLPMVMQLMKRAGLRVCVLFTESPYEVREPEIAKLIDGCWTNERSMLRTFRTANPASGYMPHGWHPDRHKPGPQPGDDQVPAHDVVFVGSGFQERVDWLSAIDWTGIDLGLYGQWHNLSAKHPLKRFVRSDVVSNLTTAALYRRAKVGLNLYRTSMGWGKSAPQIAHAESLNPRAYELAACGAFHLSTYRAEIADVFGDLVPTFTTPGEASALIRSWMAHPTGRANIASQLPACVTGMSWAERGEQVVSDLSVVLRPKLAVVKQHPRSQAVGAASLQAVSVVGSQ